MKTHLTHIVLWLLFSAPSGAYCGTPPSEEYKIAFIADAHFHDVYASFQDSSFAGLPNHISGKNATIRTMQSQLMSTRLFNENYFALYATLDDLVRKGIKYVGLVGDFSDDGQLIHIRRLHEILDYYTQHYGICFFAVPGNHDPNRPVDCPGGKMDFMGEGGRNQRIFSKELEAGKTATDTKELPTVYTNEITPLGYDGIVNEMERYGFFPQKEYLYWATPYSTYDYHSYSYEKALPESAMRRRTFEICREGAGGKYKGHDYTNCFQEEDATYLVEPVQGIWLLAIDANVYVPTPEADVLHPENPKNFEGSGGAGYNRMISHKTHVIDWISEVVKEAEELGKVLITFSHYPMVDFYDHNAPYLAEMFGNNQLDLGRMPTETTMETMAKTGVKINIAGHLHFNDTGTRMYDDDFLVNLQVPSLAAYVPGYKILTVRNKDVFEIETIEIKDVPRFKELFEHYRVEHQYLTDHDSANNWNEKILESVDYNAYTERHLTELTRKRFLPQWPDELQQMLKNMTGRDILICAQLDANIPWTDLALVMKGHISGLNPDMVNDWNNAEKRAVKLAEKNHFHLADFEQWNGLDLTVDFFKMMNTDELALKYISQDRIKEYSMIYSSLENDADNNPDNRFKFYFSRLFSSMHGFSNAEPSDHFRIDFTKKEVIDLRNNMNRMSMHQ